MATRRVHREIGDGSFKLSAGEPLTLAAYSAGPVKQAWVEPTAVGRTLLDMPLFLEPEIYINVPLGVLALAGISFFLRETRTSAAAKLDWLGFGSLSIAIAGTNGKSTTAEMIQRVLSHNNRKAVLSGDCARPICSVVEQTRDLDFLVLQVNARQLETTEFFRPAVAALMNLAPDNLDYYGDLMEYVRANARLFRNQQPFDWAVVQSEALTKLRELDLPVPAKTITFSASDPQADIYLNRGLILSRLPNWSGPLLDIDHCQVSGPHNAENLMAALAVGHVLRLPLEQIADTLKTFVGGPYRFELVAEINGVRFINDSKATNLDAMQKALLATRQTPGGEPNIFLIAGGKDNGLPYHDAGPTLSKRVKHAFLIGESAGKIRAAWSLFIPCTISATLIKAITEAASHAASGDVVLLSPACSSQDQFRNHQQRGEIFCETVKSISRGATGENPNALR